MWFANIPIENKVSEVKHTCESLDGLFPHLEIKNITSNQDYKNIITTEILRLIGQLDNVSSCESLTNPSLYKNYYYGIFIKQQGQQEISTSMRNR